MKFLTNADLHQLIRPQLIDVLTGLDTTLLDDAEANAIAIITDYLHGRYDCEAIFNAEPNARNSVLVRHTAAITVANLYQRAPTRATPPALQELINHAMAYLERIADGKIDPDLPRLPNPSGNPKTKFRWGSQSKRSTD